MRRWNLLMCVGWLAATVAAPWLCAQNTSGHTKQTGAPVADQFVSTPGQMVTPPGQRVTGPGQMVTTPGQTVIPPGQMVFAPGQSISAVPGVISPFHTATEQTPGQTPTMHTGNRGVAPGRRYHERHHYRPEYGAAEGYAVPYAVNSGYGPGNAMMGETNSSEGAAAGRSRMGISGQAGSGAEPRRLRLADVPSGNRPAYRGAEGAKAGAASTAPNVIQSQEPVLTVVMKNGDRRKVRNYALTPKTLIDLDEAASGKEVDIPLSKVNLPATQSAAEQAGLSFAVPTS